MRTIDTVVIGAGQAGLAASRHLAERGVDHVVLERGRTAERWRSERWDSLRLLTPNWMSDLPGWSYRGRDPHGYMTAAEVAGYLHGYADALSAPVIADSAVVNLERLDDRFKVITTAEHWRSANVVIATGWCDLPAVPEMSRRLDRSIAQVAPSSYRNPGSLPDGGVLIVGASATGVQLADELADAGRDVVLAVGSHSRLPRLYRGMDIFWWLKQIGSLDRTIDELPNAVTARTEPSLQLVGRPDHRNLDLTTLRDLGVELAGRVTGIDAHHVSFRPDLAANVAAAHVRMRRVLAQIDRHIDQSGLAAEVFDPEPQQSLTVTEHLDRLDVRARGITSVIWATGYRRSYPWLHVPVLDERGEIRQHRGVTPVDGLYVLGQRFQHRRNSNFIDGVGRDAAFVVDHLVRGAARVCNR
ncbi:MAG TPA: NAD(P)-binding domain-containing protein [Ilumatobacteraceae bacterium]|nr:NAD(P)-binding domain-containing protein [Ilumatobacteraceae bacterium]